MENSSNVIKLLLTILTTTVIFTSYLSPLRNQADLLVVHPVPNNKLSVLNQTKIVLLKDSHLWGFRFNKGRVGFINAGCEVSNCVLTTNHSYVKDYNFDAFMIHAPTQRKGIWNPPNRRRDQIFILFSTEPPGTVMYWYSTMSEFTEWNPELAYMKQLFIETKKLRFNFVDPCTWNKSS